LLGYNPANIALLTDSYGTLHITNRLNSADSITVNAGIVTGSMNESTIGQYVEKIVFDDAAHTTINLTGGLPLTLTAAGTTAYGTAFDDTLTNSSSGTGTFYANDGNDTLIGGAGVDTMYGGAGNDTFVFHPGGGADTVRESLNQGTDTILLSGYTRPTLRC
jgi:Ca2+-binding RTX toxin-like protein